MSTPYHWIVAVLVILGSSAISAYMDAPSEPELSQLVADDKEQAPKDAALAMRE